MVTPLDTGTLEQSLQPIFRQSFFFSCHDILHALLPKTTPGIRRPNPANVHTTLSRMFREI
jgi:hypothetical protein